MAKLKKKLIIFFWVVLNLIFLNVKIFAQQLSQVIPPSPTAASIAQFADVPVSNYTGLPNIDIPIYTVKSGPLTVPISLQYHGGGIKASQEASWVGLGWSLNCGGSISRVIKGNDDLAVYADSKKPYIKSYNVPVTGVSEEVLKQYYKDVIYHGHDPEPDIFFYNFGSFSGKFVIEKPVGMENELVGRPLDAQDVKIRYLQAEHVWIINDPSGIEYRFSVAETTTSYSYSSETESLGSILNNRNMLLYNGNSPDAKVTTWYIKQISSPMGKDQISFEYETNLHNTKSQIRLSQLASKVLFQNVICQKTLSCTSTMTPPYIAPTINSRSTDITQDVYLSRINYPNGYVLFNTEDRIDQATKSTTDPKPQRLYNINVYSSSRTTPIVTSYFNFDYFKKNATQLEIPEYYRLKLNSIYINDQHYQFVYNDPGVNLPSKVTLSVDHWGYFNNANNTNLRPWGQPGTSPSGGTLIPGVFGYQYTNPQNESTVFSVDGANREPQEIYTNYFILNKIILPTGGTQTFNWESNKFQGKKIELNERRGNLQTSPTCSTGSVINTLGSTEILCESGEFDVTSLSVNLKLNFFIRNSMPSYFPSPSDKLHSFGYYKMENGVWVKHPISYPGVYDIYNGSAQVILSFNNTTLTAGKYKMYMSHPSNLDVIFDWYYNEEATTIDTMVAGSGLRVKSIDLHDGIKSTIKNYEYLTEDVTKSSGLSISNPGYHYSFSGIDTVFADPPAGSDCPLTCAYYYAFLFGSSANILPLSATGDTFVGYSRVVSSYKGETDQGKTISEYYNFRPVVIDPNPRPNFPSETDSRNGKPSRLIISNAKGKTIQENNYNYLISDSYRKNAPGMYVFKSPVPLQEYSAMPQIEPISKGLYFKTYNNYTDWCYLASETTTQYDINGNNPVMQVTQYSYENELHLQPTKIIKTDYNGSQSLETRMAYPLDLPGEPNVTNLIAENRKSIPLKVETYRGTEKLSEQITKYGTFPSSTSGILFTLPEFIWEKKGNASSNTLEKKVTINYDNSGNIIEYTPQNTVPTTIIWGYNKTQPIAKIENAAYSDVSSLVTNLQAISDTGNEANLLIALDVLRNTPSLANALITTYTYLPHIGTSTITDPKGDRLTYNYDVYGRLQNVKDKNGKILSENQYYYKN